MCKALKTFCTYLRIILDKIIDYIFSLYWECQKKPIPDLEKKHAFLTESTVTLARKIRQKELKSEELVRAIIERIKQVNPIINAVVEDRFEAALAEAKEVDNLIAAGISDEVAKKKPLLGVPFTNKESQAVRGSPYTLGLLSRRHIRAEEDCDAVAKLKQAGAILVAITNLPEMLIWFETRNPVYGMTKNPHHTGRTVGGSSGGEAAITAACGSTIALCSDLGGSTRMPAFYCGLFGHHPTPGTTNSKGVFCRKGDEESMLSLGFVTKHVEDLAPLLKVIAGDKASLLKLDREVNIKDIKFYYTESSNDCLVSAIRPELTNAMKKVISKISSDITTTTNGPQPYNHEAFNHMYSLWRHWMTKEPDDVTTFYNNGQGNPNAFLEFAKKMLCLNNHDLSTVMRLGELKILPKVNPEWAESLTKELKEDLLRTLGDNGVLIFPSSPHAAPYHYSGYLRPYNFAYWAIVNVLKCPSTQVPLGVNSQGLPLGIQVVSSPYNDALCLTVAKYLENQFGGAVLACKVKE